MLISLLVATFCAIQPISEDSLQEFKKSYVLLGIAHAKGNDDIVLKYGPEILQKFDVIQIQEGIDSLHRRAYDSLSIWVAQSMTNRLSSKFNDSLDGLSGSLMAEAVSKYYGRLKDISHEQARLTAYSALLIRATEKLNKESIDTLFKIKDILPQQILKDSKTDLRIQTGIDNAYQEAFNVGADGIRKFAIRFPGQRSDEVSGSLAFAKMDELNLMMKSKNKEVLLQVYKEMGPGKQRNQVGQRLSVALYKEWKATADYNSAWQLSQDYLEIFGRDKVIFRETKVILDWLDATSDPQPKIGPAQMFAPHAVPATAAALNPAATNTTTAQAPLAPGQRNYDVFVNGGPTPRLSNDSGVVTGNGSARAIAPMPQ